MVIAGSPRGLADLWFLGETLLFAVLCAVPLGLDLVSRPDREGKHPWAWRAALWFHWPASLGATLALYSNSPAVKTIGAALWFCQTLLIAFFGLSRWCWSGLGALEEVIINLGCLYIPVGGFWLLAHAAGWSFGFDNFIVLLTAMHFHFAGFAAPVIAGLLGRILPGHACGVRRVYALAAIPIGLAPPLVGIGIAGSPLLEIVSAAILTIAVALLSLILLISIVWRVENPFSRTLLGVAAAGVLVPMSLAVLYALGEFSARPLIDMETMVRWHGWFNAYSFAGGGLIALALIKPPARVVPPWPPLSRLRCASGSVGPNFFERLDLVRHKDPAACGLVMAFEHYRRPDFDPAKVAAPIRHFYEHTREWALHARASWPQPFASVAPLFRAWARRTGQMVLPMADLAETDMDSSIGDLEDNADGRSRVRYWIRTCRASGHPIYVAAYSTHTANNVTYMNIAFPLPGGNLTSILRFDHDPRAAAAITLSTRPGNGAHGDEGIYLVRPLLRSRLPLQESISVWATADAPHDFPPDLRPKTEFACCAKHDVWLCGLRCLTLWYALERRSA